MHNAPSSESNSTLPENENPAKETAVSENAAADSTAPDGNAPAPKPRRKRRWLRRVLWTLLVLAVCLAAFVFWLATTNAGLRFGLLKLPAHFGVRIAADSLDGTLWRGFRGENWRIQTEGADVDFDHLVFDWNSSELWQRKLHIRRIDIGEIHIETHATAPQPERPPATLPESISLPVAVDIDSLVIGGITSGSKREVLLSPSEIAYHYDHSAHLLRVAQLNTPWQNLSGEIRLSTQKPYALSGSLNGTGRLDKTAIATKVALSGSLETPHLTADTEGNNVSLKSNIELKPFAQPLNHKIVNVSVHGRHINPAAFLPDLPRADLNVAVDIAPEPKRPDEIFGRIDIANAAPAAFDSKPHSALPVKTLSGSLRIDTQGKVALSDISAALLKKGSIVLNGRIDTAAKTLDLNTQLKQLTVQDVAAQNYPGSLNGQIRVQGAFDALNTSWLLKSERAGSNGVLRVQTDAKNGQKTLLLDKLALTTEGGGSMTAKGRLELFQEQNLDFVLNSSRFNPAKLSPNFPAGNVNGKIEAKGRLKDRDGTPNLTAAMTWANSVLSGAPLAGTAKIRYAAGHLPQADVHLLLGRNRIDSKGSFGKDGDKLTLDINAPELDRFGFGLKGLLTAKGFVAGSPKHLSANLQGKAQALQAAGVSVQSLDFRAQGSPDIRQPLNLQVAGKNIRVGGDKPTTIDNISLNINGKGTQHRIQAAANMALDGKPFRLDFCAAGGMDDQHQWRGTIQNLDIGGALNVRLLAPFRMEGGAQRVVMNQARWSILGGSLNIDRLRWEKGQALSTAGRASGLSLQALHNFVTLPVEQNLVLGGDWNFTYSNNMQGFLRISRQSGDIVLPQRKQNLGLSRLALETHFQNGALRSRLDADTRYGTAEALLNIARPFGGRLMQSPISGSLRLDMPDLNSLRNLIPVGMQVKGSLNARTNIGGTLAAPMLSGTLNGANLFYREPSSGIILENGSLKSRFQGRRWLLDDLTFTRRDGSLSLKGSVDFAGLTPNVDINAVFKRYAVLDQVNRRLTISGDSRLIYSIQRGVTLTGAIKVDQGRFGFQPSGMPSLDDDVVVIGREKPKETQNTPISLNLNVDLNNRFRFSGEGLDVLLGGTLTATALPRQNPQIVGTVNIVRGQYKAYGQDLIIQRGSSISFIGPMDNPNLKIRAKRRYSQVGAGVEALGSLSSPRISLIADEAMSDKDKLSWLILNRASSGSAGDEAAIAAAAGAFLAGGLNDRLGLLDEVGLTSRQTRNSQTGELNPAEQVITIGKRLTNNLYLGYQYGIESATQTVRLSYQISRGLQTILNIGSESFGGELGYTIRFD